MDLTLRPTTLEDLPILFEHQADPVGAMGATGARAALGAEHLSLCLCQTEEDAPLRYSQQSDY
jgi:hypothetical protein